MSRCNKSSSPSLSSVEMKPSSRPSAPRLLFTASSVFLLIFCLPLVDGQRFKDATAVTPVAPLAPTPAPQIISDDFSPLVTAQCDRGVMIVTIVTQQPFHGVAHAREMRKNPCLVYGDGGTNTTLKFSLLAQPEDELYCGVQRYKGERSIALAVRMHKSLELSEDRFFYLTCHTGYKNVRGGTYRVNLRLIDSNAERSNRLIHGMPYTLRAELFPKDSVTTLRIKNCFVFAKSTDHVELIDRSGCPSLSGLISSFYYNDSATGEARIPEMFKFPEDLKVHFQCDALLCRENCDEPDCEGVSKRRELELDGYSQLSASTSVWIREPLDSDALTNPEDDLGECTEWRFPWLITLCICLAIMLLVMLLLNLFMCSSITCRCIKTEEMEKEPEEFEDYDPYRADWTAPNSLHGSRYSMENGRRNPGYTSGDDTTTVRSGTTEPDYDSESFTPDRQYVTNVKTPYRRRQTDTSDDDSDGGGRRPTAGRADDHLNVSRGSLRPIATKEVDYGGGYQRGARF